jgi:hypothetical protein
MTTHLNLTINAKHFAAVASIRAAIDIRMYLTGVCIETGPKGAYIIATNGHALAVSKVGAGDIVGTLPATETQFILPPDVVADLVKLAKTKTAAFSITLPDQPGQYGGGTQRIASIHTVTSTGIHEQRVAEMDWKYVNWRRVARHEYSHEPVAYDPRYLALIDNAAHIIKGNRKEHVGTLVRPGTLGTCGFAWLDMHGTTCAWVSPINGPMEGMPSSPAWTI